MPWKLSMVFQVTTTPVGGTVTSRTGGWSESVYNPTLTDGTRAEFARLCVARAALLPTNAAIIGQRFQQVDPIGGSSTAGAKYPGVIAGTATDPSGDLPSTALHCRTRCKNAPNVRNTDIRCVPDTIVRGGEYYADTAFKSALTLYFIELDGWDMRGQVKTNPQEPIFSVAASGVVSFNRAFTVTTPSSVQVLGVMNAAGQRISGTFKALSQPTTSSVMLQGWIYGDGQGGSLRPKNIDYFTLGESDSVGIISKKVGAPSRKFRGRRSKRKRLLVVPPVVTP